VLRLVLAGLVTATVLAATVASAPSHTPASNGWVAFASNRLGPGGLRFRLYRLEVVGGAVAPLGTLTGRAPAWSPDGSRIAFVDARLRLVVARADGTRAKMLTRRPIVAEQPAWSPTEAASSSSTTSSVAVAAAISA
jgi:WD40-like Beta Propeller Repeat